VEVSSSRIVLWAVVATTLLVGGRAVADDSKLAIDAILDLRGVDVESQPSWLQGGFGRLQYGSKGPHNHELTGSGDAHVAIDWNPNQYLRGYVSGLGRFEQEGAHGSRGGLVEAFIEGRLTPTDHMRLRLRGGTFFLPTSRENTDVLWSSPYTITYSAINTWIGEEVKPTGLDLDWRYASDSGHTVSLAATAFRNNDTAGTLLGWRGWAMHSRLTTYGEVLPLPPLDSLEYWFTKQRHGTVPFEHDLDGRTGYAYRARWDYRGKAILQISTYDNNGDRLLYRHEYAWYTAFKSAGLELHPAPAWTVAAEWLSGSTEMGNPAVNPLDMDFRATYVLGSWKPRNIRLSLRRDDFRGEDYDHFAKAEDNDESGHAWTAAAFWEPRAAFRLGFEVVDLKANRPAAAQSGFNPNTNGRSVILEARYLFAPKQ
jgi:hypothetical protein